MWGLGPAPAIRAANRGGLAPGARALLDKETLDEAAIRTLTAELRHVGPDRTSPAARPAF
jgi:hypothetical protein